MIGGEPTVLLVDGCEHDASGSADAIEALLSACPRLRVLATSRAALGAPGELVVPLLPFADPGDPLGDAVDLLVDRVSALGLPEHRDDRTRLAAVCARTAGIPLAIELSVGDVILGPDPDGPNGGRRATAERPGHPAETLTRVVTSTLGALTPAASTVVHRAARLVHGFTPALLQEVGGPEISALGVLHELRATGLLAPAAADTGRRLRLLDPVRLLLLDRPDAGALDAVATAVRGTLGRVRPDLTRPVVQRAMGPAVAELPNAEWLLSRLTDEGRHVDALRLARSGADVWAEAGSWTRGSTAIDAVLHGVRPDAEPPPPPTIGRDDTGEVVAFDPAAAPVDPIDWAGAVWARAFVAATYAASRSERHRVALAADLAAPVDPVLEAHLRFWLVLGAGYGGDAAAAGVDLDRLRRLVEAIGSPYGGVMVAQVEALSLLLTGDPRGAATRLATVAEQAEELGATADAARIHRVRGLAWRAAGDDTEALRCLEIAEAMASETGSVGTIATIRTDIVEVRHRLHDLERDTVVGALDAVLGIGNVRAAGLLRLRLGVMDDDPATIAGAVLDLLESDQAMAAVAVAELAARLPRAHPLRRTAPETAAHLRGQWGSPLTPADAALVDRLAARAADATAPWTTERERDLRTHLLAAASGGAPRA